jgi:hypothetical protein
MNEDQRFVATAVGIIYTAIVAIVVLIIVIQLSGCSLFTPQVQNTAAKMVDAYMQRAQEEAQKKGYELPIAPIECITGADEREEYVRFTLMCDWDIPK